MNNLSTTCNLTLLNHKERVEYTIKAVSAILKSNQYEDPNYFEVSKKQKIGKWIVQKAEGEYKDNESINKMILQYIREVRKIDKEKLNKLLTKEHMFGIV